MSLITRDDDSMLVTREVADLLRVDRNTLLTMRKDGRLAAVKLGTSRTSPVRYRRSDVQALIDGRAKPQ